MESSAHLLDAVLQLLALEEGHEDGLVNGMTSGWITQGLIQIGALQEDVASRDAPQHAFEGEHTLPVDHTSHESQTTTVLGGGLIHYAGTVGGVQVEHLLVREEALGVLQNLAQLGEFQVVGLHVHLVLSQLNHLRLGLLKVRLQIDDLTWIGGTRNIILDVRQHDTVLLDLRLDVPDLPLQFIAPPHFGHELPLEGVHVDIQLRVKYSMNKLFFWKI